MPYRASALIKRQIVQINTGNILGHVEDLVIDPDTQCVAGLVTVTPRWLREAEVLPWDQVELATGDVVLARADARPCPISDLPEIQTILERRIHISGTSVMLSTGSRYGTIQDVLIADDGVLMGYVVASGFLGTERHFLPTSGISAIGADAVIALDGSLQELPLPSTAPAAQVILPFTGTRIAAPVTEPAAEPLQLPAPLPPPEAAAVLRGEHWYESGPVDAPPHTQSASAAETQADDPMLAVLEGEQIMPYPAILTPPETDQTSAAEMLLDPPVHAAGDPFMHTESVAPPELAAAVAEAALSQEPPAPELGTVLLTTTDDAVANLPGVDAPGAAPELVAVTDDAAANPPGVDAPGAAPELAAVTDDAAANLPGVDASGAAPELADADDTAANPPGA